MSFVGDKGQEIYLTSQWNTIQVGSGEKNMKSVRGTYLNESPMNSKDTSKPKGTQ